MRLKTTRAEKESSVRARCTDAVKNKLQQKANIYTEGNLSEYLLYAGLNFVPDKEDFEEPVKVKGKKK